MRAGGEKICPAGMVLKSTGGGGPHPDEPDYCIDITEVDQQSTEPFLAQRGQSGFELVVTKQDGSKERVQRPQERDVREVASGIVRRSDVSVLEIGRVANDDRPEPKGNLKGPKKPDIYSTYEEARAYCQWKYPGGDLPTNRQWQRACGDKKYCTASGESRHTEARFASWSKGPVDVDSYAPNANGVKNVKNMTGNVWERTREMTEDGWNIIRGGSWGNDDFGYLRADGRDYIDPGLRSSHLVGFRCVAPPQDSKK